MNGFGLIVNQRIGSYYICEDAGADFLTTLDKKAQDVSEILMSVLPSYNENFSKDIIADYHSFLYELDKLGLVFVADTIHELNKKNEQYQKKRRDYYKICDTMPEEWILILQKILGINPLIGLQVEVNEACNEKCIHCYIPGAVRKLSRPISLKILERAIDDFVQLGGFRINLTGGEVLLHRNICDIVDYCYKAGLQISILSNLTALNEDQVSCFKQNNVYSIQTSLYSMNPVVHDSITGVAGSFRKTLNAIEKLLLKDIIVQISCPIMKKNYRDYAAVFDYAKSINCECVSTPILIAQSNFNKTNLKHRLDDSELFEFVKMAKEFKYHTKTSEKCDDDHLCAAGRRNICVGSNGDVYPCPGWNNFVLGSLYNEGLKEVWTKSTKLDELRHVTYKDFPDCLKCDDKDYCTPCLVQNYNENNGNMYKVNCYACKVSNIIKRINHNLK